MKTITKTIDLFTYDELSDEAKEKVKQWYLDDPFRNDDFEASYNNWYKYNFPNSELKASYSLGFCQGDGYNTEGKLRIYDVIDKLNLTDKEKRTLHFYYNNLDTLYTFERNQQYAYSCKFIDKKYIDDYVEDDIEDMRYFQWENINKPLITKMYELIFDYFENIDKQFEKDGYKYFYEIDDEELAGICEANKYMFTCDGKLYY